MIKIVFIVESLDVGGTELSLLKWLRHCDRKTFEPSVISFRKGDLMKELEALNVPVGIMRKRFPFDLSFTCRLVKKLKKVKPDLIHCRNSIPAISYGVLAARIANIPVISSIHGRTHYLRQGIKTWLWFKIMRLSHRIITVTEGIKKDVARWSGMPPERITVIYNGIDTRNNKTLFSRQDLRSSFGLPEDAFIIGTVGGLRPIKGHKYLVDAMPFILTKLPQARIVLIGQGEEETPLRNRVRSLNMGNCVKFLGHRKNAGDIIRMLDVFVLSSLSEGFPNVLLEAMMAQVPIVATRVGGVEEIVSDGQEALLVGHSDSGALAKAVVNLAENPKLRETLAANALQRVKKEFDIRTTLADYDAVYLVLGKKD
jgi:glycosyltransferase involved in cell wall biosynthesis